MTTQRALPALVAVLLAALLAIGVWLLTRTPSSLVNEEPERFGPMVSGQREAIFVEIDDGDSGDDIGKRLEDAGVIQSARLFRVLTTLLGVEDDLEAGEYEFFAGETALTAVQRISRGQTSARAVVIREGLRKEEIAQLLEQQGVVPANEFRQALGNRDQYEASFLAELPQGAGLEGFLFPATYGVSRQATGQGVVQRMVTAFDQRYQEQIQPVLASSNLSLYQAITLASIIEREARVPEDRPLIASVYLNRLEQGTKLDADPTVQYALATEPANVQQFGYWKRELTLEDLAVPSPYNTYVNAGLPPGPIANPGLDSIMAALQPADTDFLYFVADEDGRHVFAETLEEHQRNICDLHPEREEC